MTQKLGVVLQDTPHRISIIFDPESTIHRLKLHIQQEFSDLFHQDFAVGQIYDQNGFVISNAGRSGTLLKGTEVVTVTKAEVQFQTKLATIRSPTEVISSYQWMTLNTSRRLKELSLQHCNAEELLPDMLSIGMAYHSRQTISNISFSLKELLSKNNIVFLENNHKQISALSMVLTFWAGFLVIHYHEILPQLLDILDILLAKRLTMLLTTQGICESLLVLSNQSFVGISLRARITGIVAAITKLGTGKEVKTAVSQASRKVNEYEVTEELLESHADLLSSKSYEIRVSSLKAIVDHLQGTVVKANSKLLAKLYTALDLKIDKATAPLLTALAKFLSRHSRRDAAEYVVRQGYISKIHAMLSEATSQAMVEQLTRLMANLAVLSEFAIPIRELIYLMKSPYDAVQNLALKGLVAQTEQSEKVTRDFEPLIKKMTDWLSNPQHTLQSRACAATVLGNLGMNDELRKGMSEGIKQLSQNMISKEQQLSRACAKSLLNISLCSREAKVRIIADLPEVLTEMNRGKLDPVVQGLVQTMLVRK